MRASASAIAFSWPCGSAAAYFLHLVDGNLRNMPGKAYKIVRN